MTDWIEWDGQGNAPVDSNGVEIRQRNGHVSTQYVHNVKWAHDQSPFDVVAYRLPREPHPMTSTERDLPEDKLREHSPIQRMTLREELAVLLQDYWDAGVEHGREGQDPEAMSSMRVATKQAIWATIDKMIREAANE